MESPEKLSKVQPTASGSATVTKRAIQSLASSCELMLLIGAGCSQRVGVLTGLWVWKSSCGSPGRGESHVCSSASLAWALPMTYPVTLGVSPSYSALPWLWATYRHFPGQLLPTATCQPAIMEAWREQTLVSTAHLPVLSTQNRT